MFEDKFNMTQEQSVFVVKRTLLIEFYETNNDSKIKEFVYNCCIDGINF